MIALDTTPEAHRVQMQVYRRMGPEKRLHRAMEMCDAARQMTRSGIRARHPEYSEQEVSWALFRLLLGDSLYRTAYVGTPLLAP